MLTGDRRAPPLPAGKAPGACRRSAASPGLTAAKRQLLLSVTTWLLVSSKRALEGYSEGACSRGAAWGC